MPILNTTAAEFNDDCLVLSPFNYMVFIIIRNSNPHSNASIELAEILPEFDDHPTFQTHAASGQNEKKKWKEKKNNGRSEEIQHSLYEFAFISR